MWGFISSQSSWLPLQFVWFVTVRGIKTWERVTSFSFIYILLSFFCPKSLLFSGSRMTLRGLFCMRATEKERPFNTDIIMRPYTVKQVRVAVVSCRETNTVALHLGHSEVEFETRRRKRCSRGQMNVTQNRDILVLTVRIEQCRDICHRILFFFFKTLIVLHVDIAMRFAYRSKLCISAPSQYESDKSRGAVAVYASSETTCLMMSVFDGTC